MSVSEIKLYNLLREKVGEEQALGLVDFIQASMKAEFESKKDIFLTKEDKVDIIKWMFAFWVGTIGVLSGIMFAMLNAYLK